MRLHRLEVEAFGPFPRRVVVDAEALAADGLFLIHGATGAGKTSLLDALCYGLFADVPGARQRQGLRSDHAEVGVVPQVVVDFTASARRLRVTRSPEYVRPKLRGTGTVSVPAQVTLEEYRSGAWVAVSKAHDEVAEEIQDVLGLGLAQFAKVVLLPQGDFAAFLRAKPEERREVLERLFDVARFTDVEDWFAAARRETATEAEAARESVTRLTARLADLLDGEDLDVGGSWTAVAPQDLPSLLVDACARADDEVGRCLVATDTAGAALRHASATLAEVRRNAHLEDRRAAALATLARLEERAPHRAHLRDLLDAARRAEALAGHQQARERAIESREQAGRERAAARAAVPGVAKDLTAESVRSVLEAGRGHDPALAVLRHNIGRLGEVEGLSRDAHDALEHVRAGHAAAVSQLTVWVEEGHATQRELQALAPVAAGLNMLRGQLQRAEELLGSARELETDRARLPGLEEARRTALDGHLTARERWLDLRSRRLDGMAAELAAALEPGQDCPVCGSVDHPSPAIAAHALVTAEEVAVAETDAERWGAQVAAAEQDLTQALGRIETRRSIVEEPAQVLAERVAALTADIDTSMAAADRLAALRAHAEGLARRQSSQREAVEAAASAMASAQASLADLQTEQARLTEEIAATEQDHGRCPCAAAPADHPARLDALDHLRRALDAESRALQVVAAAEEDLETAAVGAGFTSAEEAENALVSPSETALWARTLDEAATERARADSVLDDPEIQGLDGDALPSLEDCVAAEAEAHRALTQAGGAYERAQRRHTGLHRITPEVEYAVRELQPKVERAAALSALADLVAGTGGDNAMRMRLSAFVLAARLEKVVALANERLHLMGGGRYLLEHHDGRAARGARSGLGLRVLDQWTGVPRDPSSLSGGEAFMTSLALALGLADAVREESGGFDLGTLFIDEGFGALDEDSLEQVLGVLDSLREGGRVVGVVSHVPELRDRVQRRLRVDKTEHGSTVTLIAPEDADEGAA